MTRYTIRYRGEGGSRPPVLIVEDERGGAYLFSSGHLQGRVTGRDAVERVAGLLARRWALCRVPEVGGYSLEGLRALVGIPEEPRTMAPAPPDPLRLAQK